MDMYGLQTPDFFRIDDLLDFSNDELFSSSTVHHHLSTTPEIPAGNHSYATSINSGVTNIDRSTNFPDGLCVPSDDVAELEWLSNFVDDSMSDIPMSSLAGNTGIRPENSVPGRARSKRSRAVATHNTWVSMPESDIPMTGKKSVIAGEQSSSSSGARKCTHCASEKTPQWRTGPMGPKTLCNACGVRYKSGRLVPEYRPAASPTFVLTEHSNSHRKVMELRRQKENLREENNNNHHQLYHQHPQSDFQVC